jgi:hypothetical protein
MITIFKDIYSKEPNYISVETALERIKQGKSKSLVESVRSGNSKDKNKLPAVCFSGKFTGERKDDTLIKHSGLIVLDFDKLQDLRATQEDIINHSFIYACWVSPSGNGLKALVKIANGDKHREHFAALQDIFKTIDKSGANPSRVCYESYDENIYINETATTFTTIKTIEFTNQSEPLPIDENSFKKILKWLHKKGEYFVVNNRNFYVFKLASACCRFGIDETYAFSQIYFECNTSKEFTPNELANCVKSAYRSNRSKFGTASFTKDVLVERTTKKEIVIEKRLQFPLHTFPQSIQKSILEVAEARSLAPHFLATAGLWTLSSLCGSQFTSEFGNDAKNILFVLMIAPISVGKTPAFKAMCETPLKAIQDKTDRTFEIAVKEWEQRKAEAISEKKGFVERKPRRYIPFAIDGTTEGYIALSVDQPNGIGVYHDEAESILNAGSFKSNNDSISFFTQAFSGGRLVQVRADRDKERIVPNLNLNLLMGTQPTRLKNIFTDDRLSSGFASRFLMVESDYIELNTDIDPFDTGKEMCEDWCEILRVLYETAIQFNTSNFNPIEIPITLEAKDLYRKYNKQNKEEANKRMISKAEGYIIGTEAKMSAYFPRLCQILAVLHNVSNPIITPEIVKYGYELYKYYAGETVRIISALSGEIETGLPKDLEELYNVLPEKFTHKEAIEICKKLGFAERRFDTAMRKKDFKALFRKIEQGIYIKL